MKPQKMNVLYNSTPLCKSHEDDHNHKFPQHFCSIKLDSPGNFPLPVGNSGVRANLAGRWNQIPPQNPRDRNDLSIYHDLYGSIDLPESIWQYIFVYTVHM